MGEKWIFRYRGEPDVSAAKLLVQEMKKRGLKANNSDLPKMAVVEASSESISELKKIIDSKWTVAKVSISFPIPDTRKKVKEIS